MEGRLSGLWVYLAQTPLLWLTTTLVVYQLAVRIYEQRRSQPWLNPVLTSIVLIVALLLGNVRRTKPTSTARSSSTSC